MSDSSNRKPPAIASGRPNKKTKTTESQVGLLDLGDNLVISILQFVGPGHYAYVAGVSRYMQELYLQFFGTLKEPPCLALAYHDYEDIRNPMRMEATHTSFKAVYSSLSCVKYWHDSPKTVAGESFFHGSGFHPLVTKHGTLEVVEWCLKNGFDWSDNNIFDRDGGFAANAAARGDRKILEFLHSAGCPWDEKTCQIAARCGNLAILKYLHESGCPWDKEACEAAAGNGELATLKYLRENGCPWDSNACEAAARNGDMEMLKYLHENCCPWDSKACEAAAKNGDMEMLRYLHENDCPWGCAPLSAAAHGHLDALKYVIANGGTYDGWQRRVLWCEAVHSGSMPVLKFVDDELRCRPESRHARLCYAWTVNVEVVTYFHERGYLPQDQEVIQDAVDSGKLDILKYLHQNGYPLSAGAFTDAIREGYSDIMDYLQRNGCPWDADTFVAAIFDCDLELVKRLHEGGCPWPADACSLAAGQDVHILKYLHEQVFHGIRTPA